MTIIDSCTQQFYLNRNNPCAPHLFEEPVALNEVVRLVRTGFVLVILFKIKID
ncbi:protein of unknown function [Legionella fallonii LLAP-10]|uniref:Uncharacterized protein n=1 Tax=Legionella fallonii LLAP-10 TaxID=1212491 RepID=A0A098G6Z7_9GAMM|nr:protein of unknown function [Legionella fallonii LLAP-10]